MMASSDSDWMTGVSKTLQLLLLCPSALRDCSFFFFILLQMATIVMAVEYHGGVVIGADPRTTTG